MRTVVTAALAVLLIACGARNRAVEVEVDPRLILMDEAWQSRHEGGLDPLEQLLDDALRAQPGNPDLLWRQTRLLVERGLAEEQERRAALDTYARARGQSIRCLNDLPAWRSRNNEVGLQAALQVVDAHRVPCVGWGAFAWARWAALMGGDAASLDLADIEEMAEWYRKTSEQPGEIELAQWTIALVEAIRPAALADDPDRAGKKLKREVEDHPNDLARKWDLLVYVAIPQKDTALAQQQRSEIAKGNARTEADKAIQKRAAAME